jgi:hypothetical protein
MKVVDFCDYSKQNIHLLFAFVNFGTHESLLVDVLCCKPEGRGFKTR